MDFRHLELFVHLSHSLHFGHTADALAVSPSTLSRAIQRLEQETSCALFIRDNRTVTLTSDGLRLQQFAMHWLSEWQQLKHTLKQGDNSLQGRLRVYCSVTASYFLLPNILERFRNRYPNSEIRLETGDPALAIEKILEDESELAIAARPDALPAKVHFINLQTVPMVFIAPATPGPITDLLEQRPLDWQKMPVIVSQQGVARKRANQWFKTKGINPNIYAEVAGNEAIISMVALGFGIGVVPRVVIDHSPLGNKVRLLSPSPALKSIEVGVCLLKKRLNDPLILAFQHTALDPS
ncbi:MAG: HTH-type transcriptional activator IlvY [Aeromonadales bacterium]|nr:HTH-type transcriptional activator IlvY [Aeromonadales bacterium]